MIAFVTGILENKSMKTEYIIMKHQFIYTSIFLSKLQKINKIITKKLLEIDDKLILNKFHKFNRNFNLRQLFSNKLYLIIFAIAFFC